MNKLRLVSLIGVLTPAACDQEQDLRTQRNIQLVERFHGEIWSDGNVDLLEETLGDSDMQDFNLVALRALKRKQDQGHYGIEGGRPKKVNSGY